VREEIEKALDIPVPDELAPDSGFQRFGPNQCCWYQLHDDGAAIFGHYGDWRKHDGNNGWPYVEVPYGDAGPGAKSLAEQHREKAREAAQQALDEARVQARARAASILEQASPADIDHQYLASKGVGPHGVSMLYYSEFGLEPPLLIVPFGDVSGTVHTLQAIDSDGVKRWLSGGPKKGHYFEMAGELPVYVVEGFATGASVHEATGKTTVVAGDLGNVAPVVEAIRANDPSLQIVIAADTDAVSEVETVARQFGTKMVRPKFPSDVAGTDFNDLHQGIGIDATRKQLEAFTDPIRIEPEPLRREPPSPSPFPVDALGPLLGEATKGIQAATQAPLALAGNSVLAAAALAVQPHVDIEIDGRTRPVSMFAMSVADSGERKSAVDDLALRAHAAFEAQLHSEYSVSKEVNVRDRAIWKRAQSEALKQHKEREAREAALEEVGSEPPAPLKPILTTQDPTLEGILKIMRDGLPSFGVFSDEAGLLIGGHSFSKDTALKTASGFSRIWDGKPVDRVRGGDELTKFYGRRVSMHLMMQPVVLAELMSNPLVAGQGLLSRCLITCPTSTVGTRRYQAPTGTSTALERYEARVFEILSTTWPTFEGRPQQLDPRRIALASDAKELWIEFHNDVESRCAAEGDFHPIRPFANKAAEHALRIAAVIEIMADLAAPWITQACLEGAIHLTTFYLSEALRLSESSLFDPKILVAEELLQWLHDRDEDQFYLAQVYQFGPASLRTKASAKSAVQVLMDHGHVRSITGGMNIDGKYRREAWRVVR
jgi:putative DNA primase/helicase